MQTKKSEQPPPSDTPQEALIAKLERYVTTLDACKGSDVVFSGGSLDNLRNTFREAADQLRASQPLRELVEKWREHARRVRPLESAELTLDKRARTAEWMHYTNRANELAALLTPPVEPDTK